MFVSALAGPVRDQPTRVLSDVHLSRLTLPRSAGARSRPPASAASRCGRGLLPMNSVAFHQEVLERFSRSCPRPADARAQRSALVTADAFALERAPVRGHPRVAPRDVEEGHHL